MMSRSLMAAVGMCALLCAATAVQAQNFPGGMAQGQMNPTPSHERVRTDNDINRSQDRLAQESRRVEAENKRRAKKEAKAKAEADKAAAAKAAAAPADAPAPADPAPPH
jgi:hypothetical protein